MKHKVLTFLILLLSVSVVFGQNQTPTMMVFPVKNLLIKLGCLDETDDMGETNYIPYYKKAFTNNDSFIACVHKINELFTDRGCSIAPLEEVLEDREEDELIQVDMYLYLNYWIEKQGPRDKLYFELTAYDPYLGKQIGAAMGSSNPAIGETVVNLLQEAAIDKIDKFIGDIQAYFEKQIVNGRSSKLTIRAADGVEIPDEVEDIVDAWLEENCVNSSYSIKTSTTKVIRVDMAMMPLYDTRGKKMEARRFYKPLSALLRAKLAEYKITQETGSQIGRARGGTLGDAYILISEKQE